MLRDSIEHNSLYSFLYKELVKFSDNKNEYPNSTLYHYTNIHGLIGILSSRRLWMTHYKRLNDINEIMYAHNLILKIIDKHKINSKYNKFWEKFYFIFNKILEIGDYYIYSFSLSHNNEKLWNEYATSKDIAIGFHQKYFIPSTSMNKRKRRFNLITIQKIHYCEDNFNTYASKLVNIIENNLELYNQELDIQLGSNLAEFFLTVFPKLKKMNWAEENECRLYQFGYKGEINKSLLKQDRVYAIPKITRGGKEVVLRKFKQNDLCEIWVSSDCQASKKYIQKLLHRYQFNNVVICQYEDKNLSLSM